MRNFSLLKKKKILSSIKTKVDIEFPKKKKKISAYNWHGAGTLDVPFHLMALTAVDMAAHQQEIFS